MFETTISVIIHGYTLGADANNEGPFLTVRENAVEVKYSAEFVVSNFQK